MKRMIWCFLWVLHWGWAKAQPPTTPIDTFDARIHPVGRLYAGDIELFVSQEALVEALRPAVPKLGEVTNLSRQWLGDQEYLVFHGKKLGTRFQVYLVAVQLRRDNSGYFFAESLFQVCTSPDEAGCANCQLTENGCRCFGLEESFCGHLISRKFPFTPVAPKP